MTMPDVEKLEATLKEAGLSGDVRAILRAAEALKAARAEIAKAEAERAAAAKAKVELEIAAEIEAIVDRVDYPERIDEVIWVRTPGPVGSPNGPVIEVRVNPERRARNRISSSRVNGSTSQDPQAGSWTHKRKRIGGRLLREHGINAAKGYFSDTGVPYQRPRNFPAVLFDPDGFLIIRDEQSMLSSPYINVGAQISVPRGIYSMPGYRECTHKHD